MEQPKVESFGASGASKIVGTVWRLMPWKGIRAVMRLVKEGVEVYKDKAANSAYMAPFSDPAWVKERLEHCTDHLVKHLEGDRTEDHIAKVAWFCLHYKEAQELGLVPNYGTIQAADILTGSIHFNASIPPIKMSEIRSPHG